MNITRTTKNSLRLLAIALTASMSSSAQVTPGFEPSIAPAVHVTWTTTSNRAYQVITATNLPGSWTATGQLIEGTGGQVGTFFDATNRQRIFRIQETTNSGVPWLDGTWEGPACQAGSGIPLLSYTLRIHIDSTNRIFTATYTYSNSVCTAELLLRSTSDRDATFYSHILSGGCGDDDRATFFQVNQTNVAYQFITFNPSGTGGGLLLKK